ncbi:myb-like DNA-binding domain protein [Ichthyophthirius multifiliis]|uniref:Myb-like DNA-binding domain protein n=1 Tax=Ichthyophthirius multifiliis TaxID=5932 RepID=G0R360_ICHMU|nr:myb-like DNA-binding domain protein [Ichthyophthirius multifiliis]EGR28083.1 myb-like DNA-binding domain protein [Ichthyophthirius multifiliis]|eukprot:XP_004027428.1 myb-like DNA-binding domain protein [Ichthyophthirius multifiliis]
MDCEKQKNYPNCKNEETKSIKKGPWNQKEDVLLLNWIKVYGPSKWSQCAETIKGRTGKQCRERWFNNLDPEVKIGFWSPQEDNLIFEGYLKNGSSWSAIAKQIQGRTENSVKNRFYSTSNGKQF